MHYTAPELVLVLTALGGIIVNIIIALKSSTKIDKTLEKAAVIEGHVNSERTKLNEQLMAKINEIDILRNVIVEKDKSAALLAQSLIQNSIKS